MQIPGTIIRINRMDQAIKLTALAYQCHISASYLSQIETGKAQPDPQILQLLARALDLDYTIDQAWLIPAKQKLEHFVRNALLLDLEAAQKQAPALRRIRKRYLNSPLALDYHLAFFVYALMTKNLRQMVQQKHLLISVQDRFDEAQSALFELVCGISALKQDLSEAETHFKQCLKRNPTSLMGALGHYYTSLLYSKKGKILLAREHCDAASRLFTQANCYPFLIFCHIQSAAILSLQEFDRPAAILTSILESKMLNLTPEMRSAILCTLCWCCVNHRHYEKAGAFLSRFADVSDSNDEMDFLRCFLHYKTGNIASMKRLASAKEFRSQPFQDLMRVMNAVGDQDPHRDKLLITLLKHGRSCLDLNQKRFYLTLLINYYDEKHKYVKKSQCLQRLAELLQGWE